MRLSIGGYSNARIDELIGQILSETDLDKRNQMIKEAYQIFYDEIGAIPLHQQGLAWGKKTNISLTQRADNQFILSLVTVN